MLKSLRDIREWWECVTLFRWNDPRNFVTIYHDGPHLVTWHAPWCDNCYDTMVKEAWRFSAHNLDDCIEMSGLGFEVTWSKR